MNCRPGDLAFVVNDLEAPWNNGALVRVVERAPVDHAPFEWQCCALTTIHFPGFVYRPGEDGFQYRDLELRPIRDPGEDAQDETLQWLPVPSQHKEHA